MIDELVSFFAAHLSGLLSGEMICFVISLFPILELRGGLIAASPAVLNVPILRALPLCIIGNLLPIPFVLLFIERILVLMERFSPTRPFALWLEKKAARNRSRIETYGFVGLVLFVGIPLPGTGAWTGSLVAALLHMPFRKALLASVLGVLIAAFIMSIVSYGLLAGIAGLLALS